jgi:hypothetical protein
MDPAKVNICRNSHFTEPFYALFHFTDIAFSSITVLTYSRPILIRRVKRLWLATTITRVVVQKYKDQANKHLLNITYDPSVRRSQQGLK